MTVEPNFAQGLEQIRNIVKGMQFEGGPKTKEMVTALIEKTFAEGTPPKTSLNISDEMMEALYAQAYNLYNQGKYENASQTFRILMMLDYTVSKYIFGLAACLHKTKKYAQAANTYMMCSLIDPEDPIPHFHAADCYFQDGFIKLALISIEMCIRGCKNSPQLAVLKERASLLKHSMIEQFLKYHHENNPGSSEKPHSK